MASAEGLQLDNHGLPRFMRCISSPARGMPIKGGTYAPVVSVGYNDWSDNDWSVTPSLAFWALESGRHELGGEIAIDTRELPMPILAFANLPGSAPAVHNDGIPLRGVSVNPSGADLGRWRR
jgi:hypothetical protein